MNIHIYAPQPTERKCLIINCPTCERPRRAYCAHFEWYGSEIICAGCGEWWSNGERHERPFARGWRRRQREHARRKLAEIGIQA